MALRAVSRGTVQPIPLPLGDPAGFEEGWMPVLAVADRATPALEAALAPLLAPSRASSPAVARALALGDEDAVEGMFRALVPRDQMRDVLERELGRIALASAGESGSLAGGIRPDLEMINEDAVTWARAYSSALVREITEEQREFLRGIVTDHTRGVIDRREAIRLIYNSVGLTSRMARSVERFRSRQLEAGRSPAAADTLAGRYAGRLRMRRAKLISRTEAIRASNVGQQVLWDRAGQMGLFDPGATLKSWIITPDDKLCPECAKMKGKSVPVNAPFLVEGTTIDTPPLHPACRCAVALSYIASPGRGLVDEEALSFHLPGRHDQKLHGRRGPGVARQEYTGRIDINKDYPEWIAARSREIFGREATPLEWQRLSGIPDGGQLTIQGDYDRIHLWGRAPGAGMGMTVREDGPYGRTLYVEDMYTDRSRPAALSLQAVRGSFLQAQALRLQTARTFAAGYRHGHGTGYYTWPKLGFDAQLRWDLARQTPYGENRVSHLYRTAEGRRWWKRHGMGMEMFFDLTPGSDSWTTLDSFLRSSRTGQALGASEPFQGHLPGRHDQKKHGRRGPGGVLEALGIRARRAELTEAEIIEAGRPLGMAIRKRIAPVLKKEEEAWSAFRVAEERAVKHGRALGDGSPERTAVREAYHKALGQGENVGNALRRETLTELGKVRPLGGDFRHKQLATDSYYTNPPEAWARWKEAFADLPSDWGRASAASPMALRYVRSGQSPYYYDARWGLKPHAGLYSPGRSGRSAEDPEVIHEIGHRMTEVLPAVQAAQRSFYQRRTANSPRVLMGAAYKNQYTRPDAFPHRYIGLDYGKWDHYEVLSMGLQGLLAGGRNSSFRIYKDPEFMDFTLGVLAKL